MRDFEIELQKDNQRLRGELEKFRSELENRVDFIIFLFKTELDHTTIPEQEKLFESLNQQEEGK